MFAVIKILDMSLFIIQLLCHMSSSNHCSMKRYSKRFRNTCFKRSLLLFTRRMENFFKKSSATLKNIIKGKFPEYSDFESAFQTLQGEGLEIIDQDIKGFSEVFDRFANSQAQSVKEGVIQIGANGKRQTKSMRHLFTTIAALPSDMEALKNMQADMKAKLDNVHDLQDAAKKSRVAAQKADEALSKAREKGNPLEISKAERKADEAHTKSENDDQAANDAQAEFTAFQVGYKVDFVDKTAELLSSAVDAKLKELDELAIIAQQMIDAAALISDYEDGCIPRLRQKLEVMKQEDEEQANQ